MQKWEKMLVYTLLGHLRNSLNGLIDRLVHHAINTENIESSITYGQSEISEDWSNFMNNLESGLEEENGKPFRSHGHRRDKKQEKIDQLESELKYAQDNADQWKSLLEKRLKREHNELIQSINNYNKEKN